MVVVVEPGVVVGVVCGAVVAVLAVLAVGCRFTMPTSSAVTTTKTISSATARPTGGPSSGPSSGGGSSPYAEVSVIGVPACQPGGSDASVSHPASAGRDRQL